MRQKLGKLTLNSLYQCCLYDLGTFQVDYFNKRRVLQEEQKDQLAMAKAQSDEAARGKQ